MYSCTDTSSTLLKKIHAIAKTNDEIIARVQNTKEVSSFSYILKQNILAGGQPTFSITEKKFSKSATGVISSWRNNNSITLQVVPDVFNDRVEYNLVSFRDVIRLNAALLLVPLLCLFFIELYLFSLFYFRLQKYRLFGESAEAKQELEKFKYNFEVSLDTFLYWY